MLARCYDLWSLLLLDNFSLFYLLHLFIPWASCKQRYHSAEVLLFLFG